MTFCVLAVAALLSAVGASTTANQENPVGKVLELLSSLEAKVTKLGEAEDKAFNEYSEWCEDAARNAGFQIKTSTAEKADLEATISKAVGDAGAAATQIEELAASIATGEADLKDATTIREKEQSDFAAGEAELVSAIDTLDRAISIISREMQKNPALLQQKFDSSNMQGFVTALSAVIDGAAFSGNDKQQLLGFVQGQQQAEDGDGDSDLGAPAAATYKTHSGTIVDVLEDLKDKAESELAGLRKAETNALHNYQLLRQSLEDQAAADTKDFNDAKSTKSEAEQTKATAEGDLAVTVKDLKDAQDTLATVSTDCQSSASDHAASVKGRAEELEALAQAKKIISETTSGAVAQSYSLLQVNGVSSAMTSFGLALRTRADLANFEVVTLVKKLAKEQHSAALAQLASRISAVMRYSAASGEDPFSKVKGLIQELIDRLIAEAGAEATHKQYCDEEMEKNSEQKADLKADISKLTTKLDQAAAASAKLKEDVAELSKELADLASSQAGMDKARSDEQAAFVTAKADLELGVSGIQQALSILREYYGNAPAAAAFLEQPAAPSTHAASTGSGSSIVGILEVCEADFSKNLAQEEMEESEAQSLYDKTTQANKITRAMKEQDVKYKTKEAASLAKAVTELSSDRVTAQSELDAVLTYGEKLRDMCVAKAETYEERSRRRTAEIEGLKSALAILDGEAAFLQRGGKGSGARQLRSTRLD